MTKLDKFYAVVKRYGTFITDVNNNYLDELLVRNTMVKAHDYHKEIPFETFIRNCVKNPTEYLFTLSETLHSQYYDLFLLNNCFNDGNKTHYGLKVDGTWFFITHSKNMFSLPLYQTEFKMKPKDLNNISYLTSVNNTAPNIVLRNAGQIRKNCIEEYKRLYLKK